MRLIPNSLASPESGLWQKIFDLCSDQATGTLFLASDNNKPGQVVIKDGVLHAASYSDTFGVDALTLLKDIPDIRFSFTQDMVYPIPEQLNKGDSSAILLAMGLLEKSIESTLTYRGQHTTPDDPPASSTKKTITYRGQTIEVDDQKSSKDSPKDKKKPIKMYRGRPVYD